MTPFRLLTSAREQLLTQVRSAIDQHVLAGAFDQDRRSQARIARLSGIAQTPVVPDLRHAGRRSATEDPDLQTVALWALLNNLKKLAVVVSASCSGSSPLSSRNEACSIRDESRFAFLAAMGDRREEWRIGFDQHLVGGQPFRRLLQVLRILERHDA